jgi:hypothetical protein
MIEAQVETLQYLKKQIFLLAMHAMRDTDDQDQEIRSEILSKLALSSEPLPEDTDFDAVKENHIEALHYLSSLVDKTKSGGWIADRSAVYRVAVYRVGKSGRHYCNTDLIQVTMVDKDHNGADGLFQRAREVAFMLNRL